MFDLWTVFLTYYPISLFPGQCVMFSTPLQWFSHLSSFFFFFFILADRVFTDILDTFLFSGVDELYMTDVTVVFYPCSVSPRGAYN